MLLAIGGWEWLAHWQEYPPFILPAPGLVWAKAVTVITNGALWPAILGVTLVEIALGLLLGLSSALGLGYLLGKHRTLEEIASPYIVASQSIPIVAIAPLLVIWLGSGLASKVLITG